MPYKTVHTRHGQVWRFFRRNAKERWTRVANPKRPRRPASPSRPPRPASPSRPAAAPRRTFTVKWYRRGVPAVWRPVLHARRDWNRLCRQMVAANAWTQWASDTAQMAVLVLDGPKLVGFLLGQNCRGVDSEGLPYCSPGEWYINVACADPKYKGAGRAAIERYFVEARRNGVGRIKLLATPEAKPYWASIGFHECDDACGVCRHRPKRHQEGRGQYTWRMTKCIQK